MTRIFDMFAFCRFSLATMENVMKCSYLEILRLKDVFGNHMRVGSVLFLSNCIFQSIITIGRCINNQRNARERGGEWHPLGTYHSTNQCSSTLCKWINERATNERYCGPLNQLHLMWHAMAYVPFSCTRPLPLNSCQPKYVYCRAISQSTRATSHKAIHLPYLPLKSIQIATKFETDK